ncbi:MAG TPA: phosphomannomutase/phosphoglucomutase [Acidimicrobiia bacterium]|nr:phosphomannomutase/phosphoglucomutase [Acidimicrobiia bacterium]
MDLADIFKAYDVRGTVPDQLNDDVASRIGAAFAAFTGVERIVVGRDARTSSPVLAEAVIEGVLSQGVDVDDIGMVATDMVYFASGALDVPGIMVTASHNPKGYNGIKLCRARAAPVGIDSGLPEIRRLAEEGPAPSSERGSVYPVDILDRYLTHLLTIVGAADVPAIQVGVDGGNGVAGVAIPALFEQIPAHLVGLYLDPDGTFPNHHPDPLRPENLIDLQALVTDRSLDLGVAFDGDADRAVFVDDGGMTLPGSTVTAMVAEWFLERHPGSSIVHNLICSRVVPETVRAAGGTPVRTRVGHSYIKAVMAESGAVFGGEHSGHYYYRDNYRADSGILTMLVLLRLLGGGEPLSSMRKRFEPYAQSGEINMRVTDQAAASAAVAAAFPGEHDDLDGLTVDLGERWFNLRSSNTEPVLRLNVEAPTAEAVNDLVAAVQATIDGVV